MGEIEKYAADNVNKLVVGNKCDLSSEKVVSCEEAKEFTGSLGINLVETSAKNAHNVDQAFQAIASEIKDRMALEQAHESHRGSTVLGAGVRVAGSSGRCCAN